MLMDRGSETCPRAPPHSAQSQPGKPLFDTYLRTIAADNQPNTYPEVRLLYWGRFAVISFWDERSWVSKVPFVTKSGSQERTMATMIATQTFVRSQSVVARVVAGETLIVPIRAKVGDLASIYSFNGTGSLIWKLLESPKTVSQLATVVAEEYAVEPSQAERDVTEFVGEMQAVGLVEVPSSVAMAGD